jgi:hypothetical protein
MQQDEFVTKAIESSDECEIDMLCMEWLGNLCSEYGTDGEIARKLIGVVKDLLCIPNE